ncbi:hypothetical protein HDU96_003909 [Phlyctochytrium bullatum]|nr:hypothetical protein HDU96_003909 [Phlyctochytrium bullatum]
MATLEYILTNSLSVFISLLLFFGYHLYLIRHIRRAPHKTVFGLTSQARRAWVEAVMHKRQDILAVQSLRNWIMSSSLMATSAVFTVFGFLAFLGNVGSRADTTSEENRLAGLLKFVTDELFGIKIFVILSVSYPPPPKASTLANASFFFLAPPFIQPRLLAVTAQISLDHLELLDRKTQAAYRSITPTSVFKMLDRASRFHTMGLRTYYLSFLAIAYIWGPYFLFVVAVAMVVLLRMLDFNTDHHFETDGHRDAVAHAAEEVAMGRGAVAMRVLGRAAARAQRVDEVVVAVGAGAAGGSTGAVGGATVRKRASAERMTAADEDGGFGDSTTKLNPAGSEWAVATEDGTSAEALKALD